MPNFAGTWTLTTQAQAKGAGIWPTIPGAPTIGTATAASSSTITVTFTANAANPGYPTPTFTATSNPGGFTGTSATSPITVGGLTAGTSYTFTVTATNYAGTSAASAASNSAIPLVPGIQRTIFGFGLNASSSAVSMTNIVSPTGVVAADVTGVGTGRGSLAAATYGTDKAIFGFGIAADYTAITNLVSNTGVVASNTTGVGTARGSISATGYGTDKAIFGFGFTGSAMVSITNLVSNTGVVATDTAGAGGVSVRADRAALIYGTSGQAMFAYGLNSGFSTVTNDINLVSNTGVVASNTSGAGTARNTLAAANYGSSGQGIFAYGVTTSARVNISNLVSNTGVVATDTTGVGTARNSLAAAGFSLS